MISDNAQSGWRSRARHRPGLAGLKRRGCWELHPGVRSGDRLSVAEQAADLARDGLGSWPSVAAALVLVGAGLVAALRPGGQAGLLSVLVAVLSGLTLVELSLLLMVARRTDRTAGEVALHDLESDERVATVLEELRDEVEQLRGDLARLTVLLQTSGLHGSDTRESR